MNRVATRIALTILLFVGAIDQLALAQCDTTWRAIDKDDEKSGNSLFGIAVGGSEKVWVAGTNPTDKGRDRPLVRYWNGDRWTRQRTPTVRGQGTNLRDIGIGRKGALWAVGDHSRTTSGTFALRRTARGWKRTNSIDPSSSLNSFERVASLSRKRVWAVGTRWDSGGNHIVLIERWNGRRWRVEPIAINGLLHGVYVNARDDAWAVGTTVRRGVGRTLTLHFNGSRWRKVSSPNASDRFHQLNAVDGNGRNDVWAVGYRQAKGTYPQPITMHWNGSRWRLVDTPDLGGRGHGELRAVSVQGSLVVAAGDYYNPRDGFRALVLNWFDKWYQQDMTHLDQSIDLWDVDHAPNGDVFAAGMRTTTGGSEIVLYRPAC